MKLLEGMRAGDLEDLVLPMISVDEYESKIDDDAIVFAFYVHDSSAAADLNRFIQKSPVPLLDTDISPSPDTRGYYLVFVEILRNDHLAKNFNQILEEVSPLVRIENWQMMIRGKDELLPYSNDLLTKHFGSEKKKTHDDAVKEYLRHSNLSLVECVDGRLTIRGISRYNVPEVFSVVDFLPADAALTNPIFESPLDLSISGIVKTRHLNRILGEAWSVVAMGDVIVVQREENELLIVKSTH